MAETTLERLRAMLLGGRSAEAVTNDVAEHPALGHRGPGVLPGAVALVLRCTPGRRRTYRAGGYQRHSPGPGHHGEPVIRCSLNGAGS